MYEEERKTGIALLDQQHEEIFARVKVLEDACVAGKDKKEVKEAIRRLDEYVSRHMKEEEEMQVSFGYPQYIAHKHIHNILRAELRKQEEKFNAEGVVEEPETQEITSLMEWILKHIMKDDMYIAEYIGEQGDLPQESADHTGICRQVAENAIEMMFEFDREGIIQYCNRAAHEELGYGKEMIGIPVYAIFISENIQGNIFLNVNEKKEISEMVAYRKNATCFPVFIRMTPDEKRTGCTFLMAVNITDQKAMEKELLVLQSQAKETLQIRNEFIANVTHELRTPVNGVKGHASALLSEKPTPEQRRTLEIIQRCCDDMSSIINNILDFSKLEAGKFELNETDFDLYELLDHVIATHIAVINEKGLRIFLNISENVPRYVTGDDLRLTQILNNLISNAVKFTDIGFISVDVNKHMQYGDEIELFFMVRDSGIGVSTEDKDRLFQSFSQVDASTTRKYGGTGLGLVITKNLVELMNGSIRVESQKGKGSNFSFVIRLHSTEGGSSSYVSKFLDKSEKILEFDEIESFYRFGSEENVGEIKSKAEKLILALELGAWEKAEVIAANLKKLIAEGPEEMRKLLFRLEMTIRKEDEKKSIEYFEKLKEMLQNTIGGM